MKPLLLFTCFTLLSLQLHAQESCGADQYRERIIQVQKNFNGRLGGGAPDRFLARKLSTLDSVITIYVVVHVLYNKEAERIPVSQIDDQIEQINKDFSATNEDLMNVPFCFKPYIAECKFHFKRLGEVRYKPTTMVNFPCQDRDGKNKAYESIKFSDLGGDDAVATSQVLNIWIGNIFNGFGVPPLLGYGTFPGKIDMFDGIVLSYKAVGANNGKGYPSFGRTLTHELGHWLDVYHLWGDKRCGDDLVKETPQQEKQSKGLPTFPQPGCLADSTGIMFMNFMDYTAGNGMYMFTVGQRDRMRALFVEGGKRASIMQVDFANNFTASDSVHRNDILTPVIKSVLDVTGTGGRMAKAIAWRSTMPDSIAKYDIQYREVGRDKWIRQESKVDSVVINGLFPNRVYEIRVAAFLKDETETTSSTPYIFYTSN